MVIYKTTNLLNGKFYVGKDEKNDSEYLGSGKILKLAIDKNGGENFKKDILEYCKSREELNEREKFWIDALSATTLGYNITEGGTGGRTKFKKIYQFEKTGLLIKEWDSSAEIKKVLGFDDSAILKVCKGKLLSFKGFVWSYKNEIKQFVDSRTIQILQYNRQGVLIKTWSSIVEIKNEFKISDRHIQLTLDKKNKTAKGFIWLRKSDDVKNKITVPKREYKKTKHGK